MADPQNFDSIGVTKEFLENCMSKKWSAELSKISKFEVSKGSLVGDGYTTILLTVDVWLQNPEGFLKNFDANWFADVEDGSNLNEHFGRLNRGKDAPHLTFVLKCFPENVARQGFLEAMDVFTTELGMYQQVVPAMMDHQENLKSKKVKVPTLPFVSGQALSIAEMKKLRETRPIAPLDNYILMLDIRQHGGFLLRDRFLGFDLDHYKLVVEAHAKLHAISWAYQNHAGLKDLRSIYPFLQKPEMKDNKNMMEQVAGANIELARVVVKKELGGNKNIIEGIDAFMKEGKFMESFILYHDYQPEFDLNYVKQDGDDGQMELPKFNKDSILKIPGPQVENEEPWMVVLHGDAWSNNMMFRYDQASGKPVQAVLLDLQISHVGDPLADFVYALYTGTTREFRLKNIESMMHVYFDTFNEICHKLSVRTLPNFTWEEFNRRFHRAKIYGLGIGLFALPIILKNPDLLVDLETVSMPVSEASVEKVGDKELPEMDAKSVREAEADERMKQMAGFMEMVVGDVEYSKVHPAVKVRLAGLLQEMSDEGIL